MGLFGKIFGEHNDNYNDDLRNDVPHGKGTKKFSNGDIYEKCIFERGYKPY